MGARSECCAGLLPCCSGVCLCHCLIALTLKKATLAIALLVAAQTTLSLPSVSSLNHTHTKSHTHNIHTHTLAVTAPRSCQRHHCVKVQRPSATRTHAPVQADPEAGEYLFVSFCITHITLANFCTTPPLTTPENTCILSSQNVEAPLLTLTHPFSLLHTLLMSLEMSHCLLNICRWRPLGSNQERQAVVSGL